MLSLKKKKQPDQFKDALMQSKTAEEFLNILGQYYDLKNCKLDQIQLGAMVGGIDKLITVSGAKPIK